MEIKEFSWEENFSFWKNMFLAVMFFTITPITLGVSLFSIISFNKIQKEEVAKPEYSVFSVPKSGVRVYASLPNNLPSVAGEVEASDARVELVRQYLNRYNSLLEPHAGFLVETADKYELDYRLLPAIAQQESNLCKIIPPETHNCWGWGIHSKGTLGFGSYEEAIETVATGLKREYIDKGFRTPEEIMSKYTPSSNGSWARGVNQFMGDME